jgi:hypothetical protein
VPLSLFCQLQGRETKFFIRLDEANFFIRAQINEARSLHILKHLCHQCGNISKFMTPPVTTGRTFLSSITTLAFLCEKREGGSHADHECH